MTQDWTSIMIGAINAEIAVSVRKLAMSRRGAAALPALVAIERMPVASPKSFGPISRKSVTASSSICSAESMRGQVGKSW